MKGMSKEDVGTKCYKVLGGDVYEEVPVVRLEDKGWLENPRCADSSYAYQKGR